MADALDKIIESELKQYALPVQRITEVIKATRKVHQQSLELEALGQCQFSTLHEALPKYVQVLSTQTQEAYKSKLLEQMAIDADDEGNQHLSNDIKQIIALMKSSPSLQPGEALMQHVGENSNEALFEWFGQLNTKLQDYLKQFRLDTIEADAEKVQDQLLSDDIKQIAALLKQDPKTSPEKALEQLQVKQAALEKYMTGLMTKLKQPGNKLDPKAELEKGAKAFSNKKIKGDIEQIIAALEVPITELSEDTRIIDRNKQIEIIKLYLGKEYDPVAKQLLGNLLERLEMDASILDPITELERCAQGCDETLFQHLAKKIEALDQSQDNNAQVKAQFLDVEIVIYKWFCKWRSNPDQQPNSFEFFYTRNIGAFLESQQWQKLQTTQFASTMAASEAYQNAKNNPNGNIFTNWLNISNMNRSEDFRLCFAMEYSKYSCARILPEATSNIIFEDESYQNATLRFQDNITDIEEKIQEIGDPVAKVIEDSKKAPAKSVVPDTVFNMPRPAMAGNLLGAIGSIGSGSGPEKGSLSLAQLRGEGGKEEGGFNERQMLDEAELAIVLEKNMIIALNHLAVNLLDISKKKAVEYILSDFSNFILQHPQRFVGISERFAAALKFTDYDLYHLSKDSHSYNMLPLPLKYNSKMGTRKDDDVKQLSTSRDLYARSLKLFFVIFFEHYNTIASAQPESQSPAYTKMMQFIDEGRAAHYAKRKSALVIFDTKQKVISSEPLLDLFILALREEKIIGKKPNKPYPSVYDGTDKMRVEAFKKEEEKGLSAKLQEVQEWLAQDNAPKLLLDLFEVVISKNVQNLSAGNLFGQTPPSNSEDLDDSNLEDPEIEMRYIRELANFMVERKLIEMQGVKTSGPDDASSKLTGRRAAISPDGEEQPLSVKTLRTACENIRKSIDRNINAFTKMHHDLERREQLDDLSMLTTIPKQTELLLALTKELEKITPFSNQMTLEARNSETKDHGNEATLSKLLEIKKNLADLKAKLAEKERQVDILKDRHKAIIKQDLCAIVKTKCNTKEQYSDVVVSLENAMILFLFDLNITDETFKERLQQFEVLASKLKNINDTDFIKARQDLFTLLLPIDTDLAEIVKSMMLGISARDLNDAATRENEELKRQLEKAKFERAEAEKALEEQKKVANSEAISVSAENKEWLELLNNLGGQGANLEKWRTFLLEAHQEGSSPGDLNSLLTSMHNQDARTEQFARAEEKQEQPLPDRNSAGVILGSPNLKSLEEDLEEKQVNLPNQIAASATLPTTPGPRKQQRPLDQASDLPKTPAHPITPTVPFKSPVVLKASNTGVRTPALNKALAENSALTSQVAAILSNTKVSNHKSPENKVVQSPSMYSPAKEQPAQRPRGRRRTVHTRNPEQLADLLSESMASSAGNALSNTLQRGISSSKMNTLQSLFAKIIFFYDKDRAGLRSDTPSIFNQLSETMLDPNGSLQTRFRFLNDALSPEDKRVVQSLAKDYLNIEDSASISISQENEFRGSLKSELFSNKDHYLGFIRNQSHAAAAKSMSK